MGGAHQESGPPNGLQSWKPLLTHLAFAQNPKKAEMDNKGFGVLVGYVLTQESS